MYYVMQGSWCCRVPGGGGVSVRIPIRPTRTRRQAVCSNPYRAHPMDWSLLQMGGLTTLLVFGAYFIGPASLRVASAASSTPRLGTSEGRRAWGGLVRAGVAWASTGVTRWGLTWASAVPAVWLLVFYGLVVHVRWALGRWPSFGESVVGPMRLHYRVVEGLGLAMFGTVYFVPWVALACVFSRRLRPVTMYGLCFGAAVGAALGGVLLAPAPFLNWYFD